MWSFSSNTFKRFSAILTPDCITCSPKGANPRVMLVFVCLTPILIIEGRKYPDFLTCAIYMSLQQWPFSNSLDLLLNLIQSIKWNQKGTFDDFIESLLLFLYEVVIYYSGFLSLLYFVYAWNYLWIKPISVRFDWHTRYVVVLAAIFKDFHCLCGLGYKCYSGTTIYLSYMDDNDFLQLCMLQNWLDYIYITVFFQLCDDKLQVNLLCMQNGLGSFYIWF